MSRSLRIFKGDNLLHKAQTNSLLWGYLLKQDLHHDDSEAEEEKTEIEVEAEIEIDSDIEIGAELIRERASEQQSPTIRQDVEVGRKSHRRERRQRRQKLQSFVQNDAKNNIAFHLANLTLPPSQLGKTRAGTKFQT